MLKTEHRNAASVRRRISNAFRALRAKGYVCKSAWKCCMCCGNAAMPEGTTKCVFYHKQDAATLRETGSTWLVWTGDADEIIEALRAVNLTVAWSGSASARIHVS